MMTEWERGMEFPRNLLKSDIMRRRTKPKSRVSYVRRVRRVTKKKEKEEGKAK